MNYNNYFVSFIAHHNQYCIFVNLQNAIGLPLDQTDIYFTKPKLKKTKNFFRTNLRQTERIWNNKLVHIHIQE